VVTLFLRSTLLALLKLTVFVLIFSDLSQVFGSFNIFLDAVFLVMFRLSDFLFGYSWLICGYSDSYLSKFCKYLILSWIFDFSTTCFWEHSNLSSDFWICWSNGQTLGWGTAKSSNLLDRAGMKVSYLYGAKCQLDRFWNGCLLYRSGSNMWGGCCQSASAGFIIVSILSSSYGPSRFIGLNPLYFKNYN